MLKRNISVCNVLCVAFCLVLALSSCGKKGNPMPVAVAKAGVIGDLRGEVKDGVLFLSFTPLATMKPEKKEPGEGEVKIAGYRIFKGCGTCLGDLQPFRTISLDERKGYTLAGNRLYFYDDDLMPGNEYAYRVYPVTTRGTRGEASNAAVVAWEEPPGPPGSVKATESDARVEISWTKEDGYLYNIYRYDNDMYPIIPLNPRPVPTSLYMDAGLTNGRTYVYEVRKVIQSGEMPREGEGVKVSATPGDKTPPGAPMLVRAEKKGNTIVITWEANTETDLAGYNVYRIMGSQAVKLNSVPVKENTFIDKNAPDHRFIAYHVTAVDAVGNESQTSQESIVIMKE